MNLMTIGFVAEQWVVPAAIFAGFVLIAQVLDAFSGITTFVFSLIGIHFAIGMAKLTERTIHLSDQVLLVVTILLVTRTIERIAAAVLDIYASNARSVFPATTIFNNIIKISIYITGILVVLHSLGISVAPIITALGIGGLAVALALKDTLSNLFAGIQVIVSRQLSIGDYVKLASGEEGHITDITWRNAVIHSLQNNVVIVPNSTLATSVITNYGLPKKEVSFSIPMQIDYHSDLDMVEKVVIEEVLTLQQDFSKKVPKYDPVVRFAGFGDAALMMNVPLRVREFDQQFEIRHEFIKRLHRRMWKEGIAIPAIAKEPPAKPATPPVSQTPEDVLE
ncbi:mechanosensitive ion channel family protein [bacterium]|nr:mechanosensitive ion channel family protein [bacterium]